MRLEPWKKVRISSRVTVKGNPFILSESIGGPVIDAAPDESAVMSMLDCSFWPGVAKCMS